MCYDISFTVNVRQLIDYFPGLIFDDQIKMNFEASVHIPGHAYGLHPIIYKNTADGMPHCMLAEWGIIPYYITDKKAFARQRATMLNIRAERILGDTKSYWYKIREKRCLVPITGFYEHREVKGIVKKVPYFIGLKNQTTFFVPGLYSKAAIADENGEVHEIWTYGIITRNANDTMCQIHNGGEHSNRMPLLLPFELADKWLSQDLTFEEYQEILDFEIPSEEITFRTVYTIRSPKPRPDQKAKNEFWEWGDKVPEIIV